ncbi:unnamed protein product, partial [Lymnaea stagnalis]
MNFWENRKIHFGIALVGFLICVANMVTTITHLTSESNSDVDENNIPEVVSLSFEPVCLDCGKLIQDPYKTKSKQELFELLYVEFKDGHSVCCINNTQQLELLVGT